MMIAAECNGTAHTSGVHGASLLLVDDDPEIREEMKAYLSTNGMSVTEAGDAKSALAVFSENRFDLIILDVLLGADNGFDLLREIRQTHTTPCIMVTGQSEATDKVVGLELGADDYVVKPVNLRELLIELVAHEGDPQTREELCRRVFNRQWQPYDRSLDSIVVKLRRKLEPNPDHPMVIKTIRGKGYLFTGFPGGE